MRKVFLLLLLACSLGAGTQLCAENNWKQGPDSTWFIKLEPALEKAKRENKFVYVLNTGSDWCGFCKVLMSEVLSRPIFKEFARKHLVLVYLDSPSKKVYMPQEQRDYNRRVARQLRMGGGVPSVALLNSLGQKINSIGGYSPEAMHITSLYQKLDLPGCPEFPARANITIRASKRGNAAKKASVTIIAWGESANQIDRPLSAGAQASLPPGKRVFFKIKYELPAGFTATLHLKDAEDNKFHSPAGRITRSGTYIFSTKTPYRNGSYAIKAEIEPHNRFYRNTTSGTPARIKLDVKLLSKAERAAFDRKNAQLRDLFSRQSTFEIVSWGTSSRDLKPYTPGDALTLPKRGTVYVKIRYSMPAQAAIAIGSFGGRLKPARGEYTTRIYVGKNLKRLAVSVRPKNGEVLKNIMTIPCEISIEK